MDEDEVQKPVSVILFRQSSVETRLSPVHLSDEDLLDDDGKNDDLPKIIGLRAKSVEEIGNTNNGVSNKPNIPSKPKLVTGGSNSQTLKQKSPTEGDLGKTNRKIQDENEDQKSNSTVLIDTRKDQVGPAKSSKPLPPVRNFGNTITKTEENKNEGVGKYSNSAQKNYVGSLNKNESFTDDLDKTLKIGSRKSIGPPPPIRVNSVLLSGGEYVGEKTNNVSNYGNTEYSKVIKNNSQMESGEQVTSVSSVGLLKALKKRQSNTEERDKTVGGAFQKNEDMATLRPKSPRPVPLKGEKEETIWDKLGTLGRKKRIKEVQEVQAEGKYAIDSPGCPTAPIIPPEDYDLEDNEERCMIDPKAYEDTKFIELLEVLKEWINDELASQRIIVQDLSEDLYDGQVLQKLLEKLTGDKLDVPEVTQSEEGQKQKLTVVLDHFNKVLGIQRQTHNKWNVESIHSKNIVAITHLLVALARHFRPPVRLPEHVSVEVVVVQKANGKLFHKTVRESLTKTYDDVGMRCERDAFDTLFDHAPDKLQVVKKSLVTFVNKHLNKMNFEVTEIESQFHDGVYLIMLMGLLEGFFVPHYSFHLTPHEFDQKVHNVNFAFELMEETGLQKPKARPEDVVNMDLKSTLRVLYNLFLRYRTML